MKGNGSVQTSDQGGTRQLRTYRLDLFPWEGILAAAEAFTEGADKYKVWNHQFLDPGSTQTPIGHAIEHLIRHSNGDTSEDHLGHALANIMIECWFERSPDSPYHGLNYLEMIKRHYKPAIQNRTGSPTTGMVKTNGVDAESQPQEAKFQSVQTP